MSAVAVSAAVMPPTATVAGPVMVAAVIVMVATVVVITEAEVQRDRWPDIRRISIVAIRIIVGISVRIGVGVRVIVGVGVSVIRIVDAAAEPADQERGERKPLYCSDTSGVHDSSRKRGPCFILVQCAKFSIELFVKHPGSLVGWALVPTRSDPITGLLPSTMGTCAHAVSPDDHPAARREGKPI